MEYLPIYLLHSMILHTQYILTCANILQFGLRFTIRFECTAHTHGLTD